LVAVPPSPQTTALTVKSVEGATVLASVKVAPVSVAAAVPSTPPVALAVLTPLRGASATTAVPVMVAVLPPSSLTVMLKEGVSEEEVGLAALREVAARVLGDREGEALAGAPEPPAGDW